MDYQSSSRPLYVMAKPAGAHCNLACQYCYYLEKDRLYDDEPRHLMSDEVLEEYIKQYIQAQMTPEVLFTWHGGETFMRPLSFYQRAMQLQEYYAEGRQISNCIQTNGTLITPEWCRFLRDNNWLVGVSIDGPQEFHDEYRRNRQGKPSWAKVMHGIDMLNRFGVEWNAMAVVNDFNADYPLDFYRFFRDELNCHYLQFTPVVERLKPASQPSTLNNKQLTINNNPSTTNHSLAHLGDEEAELAPFSVTPQQWGRFLCEIFDEWVRRDVGEYFVQLFDATLAGWMGLPPGVCTLAKDCGHAAVMEFNGDVYSCDHFVFPPYRLGNIHQQTIYQLMNSPQQQDFARIKQGWLPTQCRECEWLFACNGECPRNRFAHTATGEPHLNYLCQGYRQYFEHVAPYMDFMKQELMAQRPPSNVMEWIKAK